MSLSVLLAQYNDVTVLDIDAERVSKINNKQSTIADTEIELFLAKKSLSLSATMDKQTAYEGANFIVVATPTNYDPDTNRFDTHSVDGVVEDALKLNPQALVVIKSTIPVTTGDKIEKLISKRKITRKALIKKINPSCIKNKGTNYYSLPGITTITTSVGKGAIIEGSSTSIGQVRKTEINNIGYNFPSDTTLRPTVELPQLVDIEALASFEFIGITSGGRGYSSAPQLKVLDGKTKKVIDDVDLKYSLGDSHVTILKNTFGMSNTTPTILPIHNSNGVGISTVGFNTITKEVSVTLSVGFSTANSFPFRVNDKVLVENVSVGVGTTGIGFNSVDCLKAVSAS